MDSEANQALLLTHEEGEYELQNESQGMDVGTITRIRKAINNLKQLKSLELTASALAIFTSNTKFMLLMILSFVPFFTFLVFFEIKLQNAVDVLSKFLAQPYSYYSCDLDICTYHDSSIHFTKLCHIFLELCPFYLVLYPILELLGSTIVIKLAAKAYAREEKLTLQESINEVISLKNNLKGPFITFLWVQLLSTCTLVGLFWIVANCLIISSGFYSGSYDYIEPNSLSIGFHVVFFVALLYKYLDWSALWNMGIVISVLEEETVGMEALEMSSNYGKHCRRTGFELMLGFLAYAAVLRLPYLIVARICNESVGGVFITGPVVGLVGFGYLVKWVALVLYYYDCKAQTLQKKVDEEVGETVNAGDSC